jgi:hypothetical protein
MAFGQLNRRPFYAAQENQINQSVSHENKKARENGPNLDDGGIPLSPVPRSFEFFGCGSAVFHRPVKMFTEESRLPVFP